MKELWQTSTVEHYELDSYLYQVIVNFSVLQKHLNIN